MALLLHEKPVMTPADLRDQRMALGFSVSLLAEILHVEAARLASWEAGQAPIDDPDELQFLMRALARAHSTSSPVCNMVLLDGEL
jgi:DNA-binding transcriptional regulator YiaG